MRVMVTYTAFTLLHECGHQWPYRCAVAVHMLWGCAEQTKVRPCFSRRLAHTHTHTCIGHTYAFVYAHKLHAQYARADVLCRVTTRTDSEASPEASLIDSYQYLPVVSPPLLVASCLPRCPSSPLPSSSHATLSFVLPSLLLLLPSPPLPPLPSFPLLPPRKIAPLTPPLRSSSTLWWWGFTRRRT